MSEEYPYKKGTPVLTLERDRFERLIASYDRQLADALNLAAEIAGGVTHYAGCDGREDTTLCIRCQLEEMREACAARSCACVEYASKEAY